MILRKYGLTPEQYDERLAAQGGVCAVCGGAPTARPLQVDHCHDCDEIRGLLCPNCNSALGHAKDDVTRLRLLITYLERHGI